MVGSGSLVANDRMATGTSASVGCELRGHHCSPLDFSSVDVLTSCSICPNPGNGDLPSISPSEEVIEGRVDIEVLVGDEESLRIRLRKKMKL